ncbi:hypothetical protein SESBI_22708 [Sesbania bispinosa]|nr:hypothetical protein SESBI_22708 [Sesbania bispinosa]
MKMNSESKKMKPKADFELVLNYSNQCIWKNLKNESGAGANAACRIDKSFSATDPLSEIVWSPDKGFSLKCVDSSFTNKNNSLFGDVEPSSMVLALLQSVTGGSSTTDKPIDDVFVEPITVICTKSDVSSPDRLPTDDSVVVIPNNKAYEEYDTGPVDNMVKMDTSRESPNLPNGQKESLTNYCEKNICAQTNIGTATKSEIKGNRFSTISGQVDQRPDGDLLLQADEPKPSMEQTPSPRKHCNEGMDTGVGNQVVEIEDDSCTRVEHVTEYKGSAALGMNLISSGIGLSKKLESTAENDLQTFNCEATSAATSVVLVSKSNENKSKPQVNEMMLLYNKNLQVMHSPSNCRIHLTRDEGKEKSLSDGDSNVRSSKEENDFHLSCESCHSSKLVWLARKDATKKDSSFMNLISNMMKGYSQSTQDEEKSLALALENSDHHLPDPKLLTCNKNQDPEITNSGFKSNFCPRFNNVGTRKSHQIGEASHSKDFESGKKVHGIEAAPIACYAENNSLYRQYLQSNTFEVSKGGHDVGPSLQPQIRPINFLNSHEHWKNNSVENENCESLGLSKLKEGMTLHKNSSENVESWSLHERKEICHKSDTLVDLWITRFSAKSAAPLIDFDRHERDGSEVHSSYYCSMLPHYHKHISHLNNCKVDETREQSADDQLLSEAKKLQNCYINKEVSTGLKDDKGNIDDTSMHKFNPITHFPPLRDSEPMVSMFARRLGAIKQCQQTE